MNFFDSRKIFATIFVCFLLYTGNQLYANGIGVCINGESVATDTIGVQNSIAELLLKLEKRDSLNCFLLESSIKKQITGRKIKSNVLLSDGFYALGMYNLVYKKNFAEATYYLNNTVQYREKAGLKDSRYIKSLSNLSSSQFEMGDYTSALMTGEKSLLEKRIFAGNDSVSLIKNYLNLASINLQLYNIDKALKYTEAGLAISAVYPDKVLKSDVAGLYQDIALGLYRKNEYAKALIYARQALELYAPYNKESVEPWMLMFNTITQIYRALGKPDLAEEYYRLGLKQIHPDNISDTYLLAISYSSFLESKNELKKAEVILNNVLLMIEKNKGESSREYASVNAFLASIRSMGEKDPRKISLYFYHSLNYLNLHTWDVETRSYVLKEYGTALFKAGAYRNAVDIINNALYPDSEKVTNHREKNDYNKRTTEYIVDLLQYKYQSLNILAQETGSLKYTGEAIETGEMLTGIFDKNRIDMSENESRTVLSDNTRNLYTSLLGNYYTFFSLSGNPDYLEKAFEMSEKSKVSGFLAATRQVNATRFSVPGNLSEIDISIRRKIGLYDELISKERNRENPDNNKIKIWEKEAFNLIRSRDSLEKIFEKKFPGFYKLKFNSAVASMDDASKTIGRSGNMLSYIVTSDKLFIFLINKAHREVIVRGIDSSFVADLERFRTIVSTMPDVEKAREPFKEYMDLSYRLYNELIAPAEPYLISNKLIISPDNILSYIPFEAFTTEPFRSKEILYRNAPYLLKKYNLSYTYSVTLSTEIGECRKRIRNNAVAFAPSYDNIIVSDSILSKYPGLRGFVSKLPYAAIEAEDVVRQCGGIRYIGKSATEEAFKKYAADFKIIHLAMHTLVNDQEPSFSKMIFSGFSSPREDDMLNTYEVYNTPLNASMVVLSSCNTGSGKLTSGEGIQSLARGFIFSGGHSVVVSMWEVNDHEGSEVIKLFYQNLKKGTTKSHALKKARLKFLKDADQLRSHPYYWSTLVIYGDDSPLYFGLIRIISAFAIALVLLCIGYFCFHRVPRS